jgi:hypothetical protein
VGDHRRGADEADPVAGCHRQRRSRSGSTVCGRCEGRPLLAIDQPLREGDRAMTHQVDDRPAQTFERAERRLFAACGVQATSRRVVLTDPPVAVRVLEAGDGPPFVLVHGSGMSASTGRR